MKKLQNRLLFTGVVESAKIPTFAQILQDQSNSIGFMLTSSPKQIEVYIDQLNNLSAIYDSKGTNSFLPFPESPPKDIDLSIKRSRNALRLSTLLQLKEFKGEKLCIVTTPEALFGDVPPLKSFLDNACLLEVGKQYDYLELVKQLTENLNYDVEAACENLGEIAIRGGIIDIYPINEKQPYRIDFFGDEIESIRIFDPMSQRSIKNQETLFIPPNFIEENSDSTLCDYLPSKSLFWLFDHPSLIEREHPYRFANYDKENAYKGIYSIFSKRNKYKDHYIGLCEFDLNNTLFKDCSKTAITTGSKESFLSLKNQNIRTKEDSDILDNTKEALKSLKSIFNEKLPSRIHCILNDKINRDLILDTIDLLNDIDREQIEFIESNTLESTYILHSSTLSSCSEGFILLEESMFIGNKKVNHVSSNKPKNSQVLQLLDFSELIHGDVLVHLQHGLCRYKEVTQLNVNGHSHSEVITVEFDQSMILHVPIREAHLLTRYLSFSKKKPKLAKIGSAQWIKTRTNAEYSTFDYASKLLKINAERTYAEGYAFPSDHPWQSIFEGEFPYTETRDQLLAIEDTKRDMESNKPMDRLICGDVGYGKTEVAIRVAFKAINAGKQVAILVPTTVLCQQHFLTFSERFKEFPIEINCVSGFYSNQKNKRILSDVSEGKIDLIVGTHRLLSKDVNFHNLGLLIVDEEQRFGVKQKEKIKEIAHNVDILTLTATPIPRTLHMALSGARSMSVIESPPLERKPIETIVKSYDLNLIKKAIRFETDRQGQAFYLHNRVESIESVASRLREQMPDLKIAVGHGQMDEGHLEKIMIGFINGNFDVLVCTTIIESGIDIPNCNTLIIEGADRFGLAQLYQIRGRVGRFNKQAYAYLFLHRHVALVEAAHKRLSTLKQYNQLGAGLKIAMRDLELRGAGNILGAEQSGHVSTIGFELYCQLLKESIARLKNEPHSNLIKAEVNLDFIIYGEPTSEKVSQGSNPRGLIQQSQEIKLQSYASIPKKYISESSIRIHFHRALSMTKSIKEVQNIQADLIDRFGPMPLSLSILLKIHTIRILAEIAGFKSVQTESNRLMCVYAHTKKEYYKVGARFPRLTQKTTKLRLTEIQNFLKKIKKP
ncbi:MAG: transcription-repair coupling factor [Opitutae bacterium]|nr:transcription-repair coupling factor [Opitutae bacterium]